MLTIEENDKGNDMKDRIKREAIGQGQEQSVPDRTQVAASGTIIITII